LTASYIAFTKKVLQHQSQLSKDYYELISIALQNSSQIESHQWQHASRLAQTIKFEQHRAFGVKAKLLKLVQKSDPSMRWGSFCETLNGLSHHTQQPAELIE